VNVDDTANVRLLTSPLSPVEYQSLSEEIDQSEGVTLRVCGFDRELARLEFLKWFPRLRRLSISGLHHATDLSAVRYLPEDLELLDLGETRTPIDLAPALRLRHVDQLRIVGHRRNLNRLVTRAAPRGLSLWRLPVDKVLPAGVPSTVESLALTLGSLWDLRWLAQHVELRYLALRGVRGLIGLEVLKDLLSLEWLWLDSLSRVESIPDLSGCIKLVRVDLTELRGLRTRDALEGVACAPRLQELLVSESRLPVEAFRPFEGHGHLERIGVGLGVDQRNRLVEAIFSLPPQRSHDEFAADHDIVFMK
jgi:hypothetical protein